MADGNELEHVAQTIEGAAEDLVAKATEWVKAHPQYQNLIETLGTRALTALANEVGLSL